MPSPAMQRIYAFLLTLLLCTACQKDEFDFSLTAETQTGANTFSCLKDGRVFVPYGKRCSGYGSGCMEGINSDYDTKTGAIYIQVVLYAANKRDELLTISCRSFSAGPVSAAQLSYSEQNNYGYWETRKDLSIVISRLDTQAHIISGTFRGNLLPDSFNKAAQQSPVSLTDGRFDVTY